MYADRTLNNKQHESLDRIHERQPSAQVVGWEDSTTARGPIVRFPNGEEKVINVTGYARKVH